MKWNATLAELIAVFAVGLLSFGSPRAVAAQSMTRCAACHFANMSEVPSPDRLAGWQRSAHARHVIGCHECHGGDPWSYVPGDAHRGVLGAAHPSSPINAANLVRTCARCHQANAAAFAASRHQTLARVDEREGATCATCHGAMRATVPSPAGVEARCAGCHPAESARGEYPSLMRAGIEALNALRLRADELDDAVAQVPEHGRRVELLVALHNARTTLTDAIASVHTFDTQKVDERLARARRALDAVAKASATAGVDR